MRVAGCRLRVAGCGIVRNCPSRLPYYLTQGGSAERICLPDDPEYVPETSGVTLAYHSVVQGAEYEFFVGPAANVSNDNIPCVVCYVPIRAVTIYISWFPLNQHAPHPGPESTLATSRLIRMVIIEQCTPVSIAVPM